MKREFVVGLVFFALLGLLLGMTLWIDDPGFLGNGEPHEMKAEFREVAGLSVGDEVWVYGTRAGRVTSIEPNGRGGVNVGFGVEYDPDLRADAVIKIKPRSALGGAVISIHPGSPDQPAMDTTNLRGESQRDVFAELGDLASELRGPLVQSVANIEKISGDLSERSEDIVANIDRVAENARVITDDLRAGEGTLGKLLTSDTLHTDLEAAVTGLKDLVADANGGGGALDLLLHDKQVAEDLRETVANARSVTGKIDRGEGTFGRLVNDPTLYDDLSASVADLKDMTATARRGEGTLGKLFYDDELAARMDTITSDVAQIAGKLRKGEGTLGRLIQSDDLYLDLKSSLTVLTEGVDDARENAPVLTFASFLFGGF